MERRDFIATLGAVAAAASVSSAFAEEKKVAHHHPAQYKGLSDAAAKCVLEGSNCLRHCFGMLSMGDSSMAECTKATYDTIAACAALESLSATNSTFTPAMAKTVATICEACKKECDKFPDVAECNAMGAACKACADECHKVAV
ncbi:four-helix bundle copper-binding protein [Methylocystis parvus]|uniref:four-helix bundle copper-binding protein n=1 Tax=Methylocystis parvus TaxID=134 RepID=UPI003C765FF7